MDAHVGKDYQRVRIGIGHPGHKDLVSRYVLSDFAKADGEWLEPLLGDIAKAVPTLLTEGAASFMNRYALLQNRGGNVRDQANTEKPAPKRDKSGTNSPQEKSIGPMAAALKALLPKTKKD
ncbi:UNVERIFIED_CONTAM: hypothetical protein GTU68_046905 [Idotea baltica]|nr:hypothetical protein [Idotea baltica]